MGLKGWFAALFACVLLAQAVPVPSGVAGASGTGVLISELMYDPYGPEVDGEWVELHNSGVGQVAVSNWTVSDQDGGVDFVFPDIVFPPDGYALVHVGQGQNSTGFVDGRAEFYMWKSSSIFSGTGDDVLLSDDAGATVDFMSYGQWNGSSVDPPPPDITYEHSNATAPEGFSLALVDGVFRRSVPTPLEANPTDTAPALLITEVYASTYGENEYVSLHNPQPVPVDVSHWYITDGEGVIAFPLATEMAPGAVLTVAQNTTAYERVLLAPPDLEYQDTNPEVPDMLEIGSAPRLANDGDEVMLLTPLGTQIDMLAYGDSDYNGTGWTSAPAPAPAQGTLAKRHYDGTYQDTNTSADWASRRPYRPGQSDFLPGMFQTSNMTLFALPDSGFGTVAGELDSAESSIWLNMYEFTNTQLAGHLLSALGRNVEVRVFLEGGPVGGLNSTEIFIARQLAEAGAGVRFLTNDPDNDIHARYDYDHAKYAVIDNRTLLMMSENWGWTGVPPAGATGNRGWGVIVRDRALAGYFADVFLEDWNPVRCDSVEFGPEHELWDRGANWTRDVSSYDDRVFGPFGTSASATVTPVLAPDTSLSGQTILGMLGSAGERVYVEEFYIYKHWGDADTGSVESDPNPYLEAVIDAARRGCKVRVLMDASYYNVEPDDPLDNDNTADYVNAIAAAEGLDMEAKTVNLTEHGFVKIHNKGLIADDSVLISSINWNLNSATENREAGVIIDSPEAAGYFASVFDYDWMDDITPPFAHFSLEPAYPVNTTVRLNASTSLDNVGIVNYTWALDGTAVSWGVNFTHHFTVPGLHTINLTVSDAWGNAGSVEHDVNITRQPDTTGSEPVVGSADLDPKVIGLLLLVPVFIFVVAIIVSRTRKR